MILSIELEDFRGVTKGFSVGKRTVLSGCNGSRKSTIKEAVAFAFTGADSSGNRAPVHLISWGKDSCRVTIKTDKATILRTLTTKKNSTLKLTRGEVATSLTQTQFESMLGSSSDLFMAVFTPGYFWTLPLARQQEVLSEVAPPFDVVTYLQTKLQSSISDMEVLKFKFAEKRPDIVASAIANERRELQRQLDYNAGRMQSKSKPAAVTNVEEPARPEAEIASLKNIENLKREWADYRAKLSSYNAMKQSVDVTLQTNENRKKRREEIERELRDGNFFLAPVTPFPKEKRDSLDLARRSFKSKPQYPKMVNAVDDPTCPTCGQVVGLKHREKVKAENNSRLVEYEQVLKETEVFNQTLQAEIDRLLQEESSHNAKNRKIEEDNSLVKRRKSQLEAEASGITEIPVPLLPTLPEAPAGEYDPEREKELLRTVEHYNTQLAQYQFAQQVIMEQAAAIADIERDNLPLLASRDRLVSLEEAVKSIPGAKLEFQTSVFLTPGFRFSQNESAGITLTRISDGCPFSLLSTGETINANILFSLRLNSLMRKPVGVMFVDNADLVDVLVKELYDLQVFEAYVVEDQENLNIEIKE